MSNVRLSTESNQAALNAIVDRIDAGSGNGTIKLYTGTQPATGSTSTAGNTLLGTLTFSKPAFGDANASGVATANAITADSSADATGTATWARIQDSDGNNVMDVDVGEAGTTVILPSVNISAGATLSISSATLTHPSGV